MFYVFFFYVKVTLWQNNNLSVAKKNYPFGNSSQNSSKIDHNYVYGTLIDFFAKATDH